MANTRQIELGSVVSLWRYPVKSMMGEELNAAKVTERGLLGDRAYALLDSSTGRSTHLGLAQDLLERRIIARVVKERRPRNRAVQAVGNASKRDAFRRTGFDVRAIDDTG